MFDKKDLGQDGDGIKIKMKMKRKSFRSSIDITFWNKEGHSAFGLKRHQAKFIATGIIVFSLFLMTPPGIPDPSDAINIITARYIVHHTEINEFDALVATYTIIPWSIFLFGIYLYPYNTRSLLNGYISKLKKIIKKHLRNPIIVVAAVIVGSYVMRWYQTLI